MALTLLGRYTGQCSKYDAKLPILTCEMKQFSTRKRPPYWICVSRSIFTGASAERNIWYAGSYLEAFHYFSFFQVAGLSLPLPSSPFIQENAFFLEKPFKNTTGSSGNDLYSPGWGVGEWGEGSGEIVKLCGSVLLTEGVKEYIINLLFQLFVSCLTTCY